MLRFNDCEQLNTNYNRLPMPEDLVKAIEVLQSGGTILYPTDTIWGLGCDATNSKAVNKIFKIKFRQTSKPLIILVENIDMIKEYVAKVPEIAIEMIESYKGSLTIIYENARNLPKNLIAGDGTIAIRIPDQKFCLNLIHGLGKPIISTSANFSGDPSPISFSKISSGIKEAVDYVCTTDQAIFNSSKPSTIIRIQDDGQIQIIRS
jgi:L-threonylcarbamoyladenylate synthase